MEAVYHLHQCNTGKTFGAVPRPNGTACDVASATEIYMATHIGTWCNVLNQAQGRGPSLWNSVLQDPFRGMPIVMGEARTLYTVQQSG